MKSSNYIKEETEKINELKDKAESNDVDIYEKENIYDEIDKIEKVVDEKLEAKLNDVLPVVFSIVKETARRFKENEIIEVTATDFDKDLAAIYENVEILEIKLNIIIHG